jgi:adenosylcobinamide kinase / adenosylcobinamide-phosphate guanylyltransferase
VHHHQEKSIFSSHEKIASLPQLILILGGARSGKSTFAEQLAQRSGRSVAFIATATANDDDMRLRIKRHQAARPADWHTIEEPLALAPAISQAASLADIIVLDCMTLWVSNWLLTQENSDDASLATSPHYEGVLAEMDGLLATIRMLDTQKTLIVVTNEVGLGIVPAYTLGRVYRDVLGLVNQQLAAAAGRVYLMIAGLGVDIKKLHEEARL